MSGQVRGVWFLDPNGINMTLARREIMYLKQICVIWGNLTKFGANVTQYRANLTLVVQVAGSLFESLKFIHLSYSHWFCLTSYLLKTEQDKAITMIRGKSTHSTTRLSWFEKKGKIREEGGGGSLGSRGAYPHFLKSKFSWENLAS